MKTEIRMGVLGVYIYNATRNAWYVKGKDGRAVWGSMNEAKEWTEGYEEHVESIRENVSGNDTTFTIAVLH